MHEERREAFERAFLERESHVAKAEGFVGFELLRRDRDGEYVVLSRWQSDEAFKAWVNSDLFSATATPMASSPTAAKCATTR